MENMDDSEVVSPPNGLDQTKDTHSTTRCQFPRRYQWPNPRRSRCCGRAPWTPFTRDWRQYSRHRSRRRKLVRRTAPRPVLTMDLTLSWAMIRAMRCRIEMRETGSRNKMSSRFGIFLRIVWYIVSIIYFVGFKGRTYVLVHTLMFGS